MDRWQTKNIVCEGGLDLTTGLLEQGTIYTGTARELINYEPADDKGYRKIKGYIKYDSTPVPGLTNSPILGVQPYKDLVIATRYTTSGTPSNDIYKSSGTGWTKINTAVRPGGVSKVRFATYSITQPVVIICDGVNHALKYNGTSDTTISGTGAPLDPKYAIEHRNRLVLSGYSSNSSAISLSAPNNDIDFLAANGAIEINVGDTVTGLASFRETLYIFCLNSIHKLSGLSSSDFRIDSVTDRMGCVNGDTIQEVAGDLIFLAADGLRSLAATEKFNDIELGLQSRQIQPLVRSIIRSNIANYSSIVIGSKSQYEVFYHQPGVVGSAQRGLIGKFKPTDRYQYSWAQLLGVPVYCAGSSYTTTNDEVVVFGHFNSGFVYRMESGGSFDGAAIPTSYKSPPLTFDDIEYRKVVFKTTTILESDVKTFLNVKLILDEYSDTRPVVQPNSKVMEITEVGAVYGTALYNSAVFTTRSAPKSIATRMEGAGATITIQYSSYNTDEPHRIDSVTFSHSIKTRRE